MRINFKSVVYLFLAFWFSAASAGSYEYWFQAVKQDDAQAVRTLLQRGFDPNTLDPSGRHGLYIALQDGSLKVSEALVAWPKTNVEWRTAKDESPLMMASLKGHKELVKQLIAREAHVNKVGWAPLHYAATSGNLEIMELLLEHHAFIDTESPNKTTPLMMAAQYGSTAAVKLLLDEGADPTLRNQLGLSAVEFAQLGNRPDAAALVSAAIRARSPKGKW